MATAIIEDKIQQIPMEGEMSKASDFAKAMHGRPTLILDGVLLAHVSNDGYLIISSHQSIFSPDQALKFARWINETFAEKRALVE